MENHPSKNVVQVYEIVSRDRPENLSKYQSFDSDLAVVGALDLYSFACSGLGESASFASPDVLMDGAVSRAGQYEPSSVERAAAIRLNRFVADVLCDPAERQSYDEYRLWVAAHSVTAQVLMPERAPLSSVEREDAVSALRMAVGDGEIAEAIVAGFEQVCAEEGQPTRIIEAPYEPTVSYAQPQEPGIGSHASAPQGGVAAPVVANVVPGPNAAIGSNPAEPAYSRKKASRGPVIAAVVAAIAACAALFAFGLQFASQAPSSVGSSLPPEVSSSSAEPSAESSAEEPSAESGSAESPVVSDSAESPEDPNDPESSAVSGSSASPEALFEDGSPTDGSPAAVSVTDSKRPGAISPEKLIVLDSDWDWDSSMRKNGKFGVDGILLVRNESDSPIVGMEFTVEGVQDDSQDVHDVENAEAPGSPFTAYGYIAPGEKGIMVADIWTNEDAVRPVNGTYKITSVLPQKSKNDYVVPSGFITSNYGANNDYYDVVIDNPNNVAVSANSTLVAVRFGSGGVTIQDSDATGYITSSIAPKTSGFTQTKAFDDPNLSTDGRIDDYVVYVLDTDYYKKG